MVGRGGVRQPVVVVGAEVGRAALTACLRLMVVEVRKELRWRIDKKWWC